MKITKGLDIAITGEPVQIINDDIEANSPKISTVAVITSVYHLLRPSLLVAVGDHVKTGQALFTDKRNPGINFTSPGAGVITHINRGAKRALQSIIIKLDEKEKSVKFSKYSSAELDSLPEADIRKILQDAGAWTAIRTRPYSKTPEANAVPAGIFIKAIDTDPLAANPELIINHHADAFLDGLKALAKLTKGKVYVCQHETATLPASGVANVETKTFDRDRFASLYSASLWEFSPEP